MKNFQFSKYCSPAQLYLILGGISIIGAFFTDYAVETLLTHALFLVVWAWVLNWLCSKGFKAISWILVLLPFIMALFTYFLAKDVVAKSSDDEGFANIKEFVAEEQEKARRKKLCSGCSSKGGRGAKGEEVKQARAECRAKYCN